MTNKNKFSSDKTEALKLDAVGIDQLETLLRKSINEYLKSRTIVEGRNRKGSYERLSVATGISTSYLHQFNKDNKSVSIQHLNKLACHFSIRYAIINFTP